MLRDQNNAFLEILDCYSFYLDKIQLRAKFRSDILDLDYSTLRKCGSTEFKVLMHALTLFRLHLHIKH